MHCAAAAVQLPATLLAAAFPVPLAASGGLAVQWTDQMDKTSPNGLSTCVEVWEITSRSAHCSGMQNNHLTASGACNDLSLPWAMGPRSILHCV